MPKNNISNSNLLIFNWGKGRVADIVHTFKRKKIKESILTVLGYLWAGAGSVISVHCMACSGLASGIL